MQSSCPQCQQKIVIDDAKVPDRAFSVKCPKCQTVVKFPGKGASAAAAPAASTAPAEPPAPGASSGMDDMRAEMAELRRELSKEPKTSGKVLIALLDRSIDQALAGPLTRQGYTVEDNDNADEGGRLVEQGVYNIVITSRAPAAGGRESVFQRMSRVSPEQRRRVFLVLVGEEFKSGDGTQAFASCVDLVLSPRDAASAGALIAHAVAERTRLYQVFVDARNRFEAASAI